MSFDITFSDQGQNETLTTLSEPDIL